MTSLLRTRRSWLLAALMSTPSVLAGQDVPPPVSPPLEALAERATQAVVLIDVQTATGSRQGSGFLVEPGGLILTNHHVVRDARSARVKLASGDVYDRVSILAQDERRDIAVLQVSGFALPTLPLGNSDSVRIGSSVILIGSPLGLENTVSTGIVSGRRQEPEGFQLIQITAPASPGSSGGAALSAAGEVIGIVAAQQVAGQNLNFAVPINYARGLIQGLNRATPIVLESIGVPPTGEPGPPANSGRANLGLSFDVEGLRGYVVESQVDLGGARQRRSLVTYRVIETVGGTPPRIERYLESQTSERTEPFGTWQTVRRERVRSLVAVAGLRPISSRGQVSTWTGDGWQESEYDVRFEGDRVLGIVTDSAGRGLELDRVLPSGVLLRDMRDLAFATLVEDSLIGRSVEFETFDPRTGQVGSDRYDVLGMETIEVVGESRSVLRVNIASGLTNETVYFERRLPRIALRRVSQDGSFIEEVTRLEILGSPGLGR
jgi:S1-C subfamily serine protease